MNEKRYYDFHWQQRGGRTAENPHFAEKTRSILDMIPQDVLTIADIGCGDGAITNVLAQRYQVIAVDISEEALKHISSKAFPTVASADCIPLPDESVDLVLSSEMLEHLPDKIFDKACREIKRVSKKYIMITVPNKEKLRRCFTKCNACRFEFHISCHLRSFNLTSIARYFTCCVVKHYAFCGSLKPKSFDIISYFENKLANSYFSVSSMPILCPSCGKVLSFPFQRNFAQKLTALLLESSQLVLNSLLKRKPEPYWLVVLLEKDEGLRI